MIFKHKTDLMRELIRLVSHGYTNWISGEVEVKKAQALILKFTDRYAVNATPQQRYRRKAKGESNAHLLMVKNDETGHLFWWLVFTNGEGLIHQMEKGLDARERKTRIQITGYELVKTPRKGEGNTAQWSWRMTNENYEAWEERIKTAVRKNSDDLIRQALFSLQRVPGFSESRKQAFNLERYAKREWKRTQKGAWPYDGIFVGWLGRFKKPTTLEISDL